MIKKFFVIFCLQVPVFIRQKRNQLAPVPLMHILFSVGLYYFSGSLFKAFSIAFNNTLLELVAPLTASTAVD